MTKRRPNKDKEFCRLWRRLWKQINARTMASEIVCKHAALIAIEILRPELEK